MIRDYEVYMEGNLIDIPFFYFYNFSKKKIKERKKERYAGIAIQNSRPTIMKYIWNDSKGNERGVEIMGSPITGVPGEYEYNVLMSLFYLYSKQNNQLTILNGSVKNLSPEIYFNLKEVARVLGIKNIGGSSLKKIKEAIDNLTTTTVTEIYENSLYKSDAGVQIEKKYHILEYTEIETNKSVEGHRITGKVVINRFFFENLCNSYFKIIDYESYINLKSIIARRLYLILSKWRNERSSMYLKYETLYNRIPLTEGENFKKNQNIRNAAKQLINIGFLVGIEPDREGINFKFTNNEVAATLEKKGPKKINNNKTKPYETISDILQGLKSFGLTDSEIDDVLKNAEMNYLKALMKYADTRRMAGTINKNDKNFLLKGIRQPYNIDRTYFD